MSDPNLENISIQEYLDMSLPDNIDSSNEAVLYPQFFRNFVFRRVGDINNTKDVSSLVEWPKGAVIHDIYQNFLMNKPIELVPDLTSAPLSMKPKKKYVLHQTQPVPPIALKYEEEFILPMAGVVTTIINFKKRNQRFTRPITAVTKFPKASMSDVLNVISYESLYRARILGMLWAKQHRRFKYIWTNIINNIAAMPDRQHFIPIPVGERAYERSKFLLSFKKYDKMSIMHPNDPWYLFMMHFVGFMHCFPTESIFEKIPKNLLGNIHFALFSKREFVIYNLEKLKAFNTDSDGLLLRFITQVNSLSEIGGYRCEESIDYGDRDTVHDSVEDPTELTVEDDELFSDTDSVEDKPASKPFGMYAVPKQDKPEETVSVPVATEPIKQEPQPVISEDQTKQLQEAELKFKAASADLIKNASVDSDVTADTIEIKVGNSVVKDDSPLSPEVEKPVPVAKMSPAAVAKAMAEAKDEFSDLNISPTYIEIDDKFLTLTSVTNDLNAPKYKEEVTQQELEANTTKFIEEVETKTKEFVEQAEDLTKAQRERAEKMSKVWETLPVNGRTIKEIVSETPNERVDHRELTFLQDDPDIVDKSMLESSLDRFDKDYMDKMFMKDMLSNMLKFNTLGMFLKDINITDISDSLNNLLDIAVKFEDVRHKEHSFHFSIPKVDENGYIKLNGGLKVLKKQRIDMPICKISPTIVRLSSDSNKYRIIRNETSAHNFLAYIGRMIRKAGAKVKVEYNQFNYNNIKLPYEYTELATKYGSIVIDGALSLCLFFDYEHRFDIVTKFNFGDEKLKTIKINERKFEGVLIGVDRYRSEYYSKLDGSTVIVDVQGNVVKTTLIDILCDEMEVSMTPLSEWIDMNLLGKLYIPVIFVLAYRFGLSNMLEYTKTKYFVLNKNERMQRNWSDVVVRFKDKTLIIPRHPLINSLIFSGLNAFDLKDVMMEDMDGKDIYYDLLRSKGKSTNFLKGIDNYFDLFMDAQTRDVLLQMKEPTDTRDLLIRAVQLLSTEDHNPTASASNYRFRSYERFNTAIYKTLSMSFANWRAKGLGATHKWSIPDYEIMKMISEDQLLENVDTINPVNDIKYHHEFSHSGIGGRSSVDTFMVNDRQFPEDGVGTMTEATVDSSKTGYAGSLSTNPIITNLRGMVITKDPDELKPTQMVSVTAVLFPFGTHDDGKRLNFVSVHSSHYLGVNKMDINRARSGFDKIVAHRCRYPFAQPAREDGTVIEHDEEAKLLKVKYKSGEVEAFKYGQEYVSNGGGGFYCTQEMINNGFSVGDKVKKGDIVTFNEKFFGKDIFSKQVIWKLGRMTDTVLMEADGTLDDACKISRTLAFDLGFQPCHIRDISLDISTNVHMYAAVGTFVKNIDPLLIYDQSAMTDDMFGTLDAEAIQMLTKLNRKPIKAKFSGKVVKIEAFYKCSTSDMSPSLKKLVSIINKDKVELKKKVEGTINSDNFQGATDIQRSDRIGMSDIGTDNVILRFYIQQEMGMQAGSKIEFAGSLKSVCSEIVDEGWELENGDHVDAQFSAIGINNRIVLSPFLTGLTNKVMGHLEKTILDEYFS